jgi:putative pyoverdin transport system ATP-binding/permease protein
MKLLIFFLERCKLVLVSSILIGFLGGASSAAVIGVINEALRDTSHLPSMKTTFVALAMLAVLSTLLSQIISIHISQSTVFTLRMQLARQLLAGSLRDLEATGSPKLLAVLTEDVNAISIGLNTIPSLCSSGAVLVGCVAYLGWLSAGLLMTTLSFIAIGVVVYQLLRGRARRVLKASRESTDALFKHFRALIEGIKELQLHRKRREMFTTEVLQHTASLCARNASKSMILFAAAYSWNGFLFFSFLGLLLFVLPELMSINASALTGYSLFFLYLMGPLSTFIGGLPNIDRAAVAIDRVTLLKLSLTSVTSPSASPELTAPWTRLALEGVTHSYYRESETHGFTLGPLNLCFTAGEIVFVIGGNGSGKTTFAKLLTGLYTSETGRILLDGRPIDSDRLEYYRQHFSTVFSDFYLFDSLLGLERDRQDDTVSRLLAQLRLDRQVRVIDGILSTTDLSVGQRKRLALLTAYLEDRPIYVFDEWAADQDPEFKKVFYLHLLRELKSQGKTIFVISHDDRYFHVADRIITLDGGLVESDQYTTPCVSNSASAAGI